MASAAFSASICRFPCGAAALMTTRERGLPANVTSSRSAGKVSMSFTSGRTGISTRSADLAAARVASDVRGGVENDQRDLLLFGCGQDLRQPRDLGGYYGREFGFPPVPPT